MTIIVYDINDFLQATYSDEDIEQIINEPYVAEDINDEQLLVDKYLSTEEVKDF